MPFEAASITASFPLLTTLTMLISNFSHILTLLVVLAALFPAEAYAFGAGDIPDFAYLNDRAFRHGDIENVLSGLTKTAGVGGLLSFAQSSLASGSKFSKMDIKRVYFGNWLRDYSQAMDIAGLSKLSSDTIVLLVSILGFLTFGFATEEFQVTAERLGVYLPVEHIDNPMGYAEKEGDARRFHQRLRPPVNPKELEIDPRTGMKKYMATENHGWDTSTAHIRRTFRSCINHGRRSQGKEGADLWEAYRLLGSGLHTMEDLLAHSNWCEIALRKMGYVDVFCHVGDRIVVKTPNGHAPPIVTGTFGSADFMHSMMGEATDHLSQASVVDLWQKLDEASQEDQGVMDGMRQLLIKLVGGGEAEESMEEAEKMKKESKAYRFNPDDIASPEVQKRLLNLLRWRDNVYREVIRKIESIPGLTDLIDTITNELNTFVYMILAPYITPLLQQVTSILHEGSKAIIDSEDQYEVFNNPHASNPSHSLLSKDHFALILNEPAGKIAQVVVCHTVKLIVGAWFDQHANPNSVIDHILEAFHHPYYATGHSQIQEDMFREMEEWFNSHNSQECQQIIEALTKESVREGKNKRFGSDSDMAHPQDVHGEDHGHKMKESKSSVRGGREGKGKVSRQKSHQKRSGDTFGDVVVGMEKLKVKEHRVSKGKAQKKKIHGDDDDYVPDEEEEAWEAEVEAEDEADEEAEEVGDGGIRAKGGRGGQKRGGGRRKRI